MVQPHPAVRSRQPTLSRQSPRDAYLWVKVPGESDGTCNVGPVRAGVAGDALGLAHGSRRLIPPQHPTQPTPEPVHARAARRLTGSHTDRTDSGRRRIQNGPTPDPTPDHTDPRDPTSATQAPTARLDGPYMHGLARHDFGAGSSDPEGARSLTLDFGDNTTASETVAKTYHRLSYTVTRHHRLPGAHHTTTRRGLRRRANEASSSLICVSRSEPTRVH